MSCCGQKRALYSTRSSNKAQKQTSVETRQTARSPYLVFRYEGQIAAIFTGAVTQKKYRFHFHGETRIVDYRDADAFLGEPLLKQIILP